MGREDERNSSSMETTESSSTEESSATRLPNLGRFAWAVVGLTCVPCLLREENTKYVPLRLVKSEVESQFVKKLKIEALNWFDVETFHVTKAESNMLNHINRQHCDRIFGDAAFSENDLIVKLDDLIQYYNFLDTSYNMILSERSSNRGPPTCGFVRINDDNNSIVPYVVKNKQKYLPIFYFDGETESLEAEAIAIDKWDLAYLKFCCVAQGIKNDLFAFKKCLVISLEQIKLFFTKDTKFDDFWPAKALRSLQSTPSVEVGDAAQSGTAKLQQSTSYVKVSNPAQSTASAKTRQPSPHVDISNHSRGRKPPPLMGPPVRAPPPSYPYSVESKKPTRWNTPSTLRPIAPKSNCSTATTNSSNAHVHEGSSGPDAAMTRTVAPFPHPHPPMRPMRQPYPQRKNFYPRQPRWPR